MAQADDRIRKLKINTGIVKRITKEKDMYEKEAVEIEGKIKKLEEKDDADEYVVRKQKEVLQESKQMIPDTLKRLKNALELLEALMQGASELAETEEYKAAKTARDVARKVVES
ncbi:tubulin-specific chaperone A-like [Babylonia areolata]|uniref:tubulin-specific chaperone A-like n=1 Tax=Babylonia areolata TaxID=304850 RepID=UPI003FD4884A